MRYCKLVLFPPRRARQSAAEQKIRAARKQARQERKQLKVRKQKRRARK